MLEDRTFVGSVPGLRGVLANARTLEKCRDDLAEVIEGWILVRVASGSPSDVSRRASGVARLAAAFRPRLWPPRRSGGAGRSGIAALQAPCGSQGASEEELDLRVDAPQLVGGPALEGLQDLGVD